MCFQHRPLLDVDFTVAQQIVALPARGTQGLRIGSAAKCANRVSHRKPLGVGQLKRFQVERAGHCSTAEVGSVIAQAFLIRKAEYLDAKWKALLSLVQALNTGK